MTACCINGGKCNAKRFTTKILAAAKNLLVTTLLPISEISDKCGFHTQAYFCDCFKRHFHITPKHFREKHKHPDEK